jgi:hypothetical protein
MLALQVLQIANILLEIGIGFSAVPTLQNFKVMTA